MNVKIEVDAIGLLCPLPVLRLKKRMMPLDAGDVARLLADDPAALIDVPHFCAEAGFDYLGSEDKDGFVAYLVRKS